MRIKSLFFTLFFFYFYLSSPVLANIQNIELIEKQLNNIEIKQAKVDYLLSFEKELTRYSTIEIARYWYLVGMAYEGNKELTKSISAFSRSINTSKDSLPSTNPAFKNQLVQSLIERSYSKYLQTYDPTTYCGDRKEALEHAKNISDVDLKVRALVQYSFCFTKQKDKFAYALSLLDQALELAKKNQLAANTQGMIYNALGHMFTNNQLHEKGYQYLLSAYQQWALVNDYQDMFNMLHSLVGSAINNLKFDTANLHVNAMFALAEEQPTFTDFLFFSHYNAALLAKNQGKFSQAIEEYKRTLDLQETTLENYFIRDAYESLAIIYFRTSQFNLAKLTLAQYKEKYPNATYIAKTIIALEAKVNGNEPVSYETLFTVIDEQVKQRREFTHFAVQANASIHSEKINALDIRVLEKDLSISQLTLANTIQEKELIYTGLLFTALFVLSLIGFIGYLLKLHLKFKHYARSDGLTGIANRRFILELGQKMLKKLKSPTTPLTILLFDIDNFKQINDKQGHHVGDQAIKLIVNSANKCLRKQDKIGRIGGDEFLLLLPDTNNDEAQAIAERIRESVEQATQQHFHDVKLSHKVSVSIGVISAKQDDQLQAMIIRADNALYRAKDLGRNVVVVG